MRILLLALLLSCHQPVLAELYRSVTPEGKVIYSDRPEPQGKAQQLRFGKVEPEERLPYATQQAMRRFPVTLYVADGCGPACVSARALLKERGIPYSEKNLVSKEEIDAFKAEVGADIIPVLKVGKTWLKGFLAEQWHEELDLAGYPRIAPYRPAPAAPAP